MHDVHICVSFSLSRLITNVALGLFCRPLYVNSSAFIFRVRRAGVGLNSSNLDTVANIDPINICTTEPGGRAV